MSDLFVPRALRGAPFRRREGAEREEELGVGGDLQIEIDEAVHGDGEAAGQRAEYVQVEGAGHAFFDWKADGNKATFARYGVPYAAQMEAFFNSIFYPAAK